MMPPMKSKGLTVTMNHQPKGRLPSNPTRRISPAEWAWLDRINRQLAHDEYMQARREFWLAARPAKGRPDRA